MTSPAKESIVCGVCRHASDQPPAVDNADWDALDLDTRPAEPLRGTLAAWLQRCPNCGYCAENLSQAHPQAAEHMAAEGYVAALEDPDLPETTRWFLRRSHLEESTGDLAAAGWQALFAAWGADDAESPAVASRCRNRAADCFQAAVALDQPLADQAGDGEVVLVDIYRRAGMMSEARLAADRAGEQFSDPLIQRLVQFQRALIDRGDAGRYTAADLPTG